MQAIGAYLSAIEVNGYLSFPLHVAEAQKGLAEVFADQGRGLPLVEAEVFLARAINAYEAAASVLDVERSPELWAQVRAGMARVMSIHAQLDGVDTRTTDLEGAIELLGEALLAFERVEDGSGVSYCKSAIEEMNRALESGGS